VGTHLNLHSVVQRFKSFQFQIRIHIHSIDKNSVINFLIIPKEYISITLMNIES